MCPPQSICEELQSDELHSESLTDILHLWLNGEKKAEQYDKIHFGLGDSCQFNDVFSQSISVFQLLCGCMFIITPSITSSSGSLSNRIDHVLALYDPSGIKHPSNNLQI